MEVIKAHMKIGARVLTRKQAERLLSNFPMIDNQLAEFRMQAENYSARSRPATEFDNQFVNTVSILGGRGSGKTSVLLTLKYNLQQHVQHSDIILPLIVPDQISEPNDTLGWILSFLKEEVRNLEKEQGNTGARAGMQGFQLCIKEEPSKLQELFDKVYRKYLFRSVEYHSMIQRRDEGIAEFKRDNLDIITSDHQLISAFRDFVDELIAQKRQIRSVQEEPLLFIFFDDVDISAHRCPEVLDTIRIFLSHPNIISFVSGNYKEFSEAMTLEFLRKDQIQSLDLDKSFISVTASEKMIGNDSSGFSLPPESSLEVRKARSQEYLKKVFPPTFRYQMRPLSNKAKAEFSYEVPERPDDDSPTIKELLSSIHFDGDYSDKDGEPLFDEYNNVYFRAFDSNPRGLINPYYYLHQRQEVKWSLDDLRRLLDVMIASSYLLQEYEADIRSCIVFESKQVDYKRLDKFFERLLIRDYMDEENRPGKMHDLVTLFSLASLFDRLLCRMNNIVPKERGENLLRFLNRENKWLFPQEKKTGRLIELYDRLTEIIPLLELNKLFSSSEEHLPLYWEEHYFEELSDFYAEHLADTDIQLLASETDNKTIRLFEFMAFQDSRWLEKQIEFIVRTGRDLHDMHLVFQKDAVTDLSDYFEYLKPDLASWGFRTTEELYLEITKDIEQRLVDHADSEASVQDWKSFYAGLYRYVVERSRKEQPQLERTLMEKKEEQENEDRDEESGNPFNRFFRTSSIESIESQLEVLRKNIERFSKKPEYDENGPLLANEHLLEVYVRLEMRVYVKQLRHILQMQKETAASKAAKLLGALEVILSSCKSKFTYNNGEIVIDGDIHEALIRIKNLPFAGEFDNLCDIIISEEKLNYNEYKAKVDKIRESVLGSLGNRNHFNKSFPHIIKALETLEVKHPTYSKISIDSNDYETRFMQQAYTKIVQMLLPLYTHLKTYVYFTETEQNEAIKYFRDTKREMIAYGERNRYANRTLFVQLMESILLRESQSYALD